MPIIETRNLCKRYGTVMRVTNLALQVPEGSIYGFLGPNGAGKSTTLKMILGLVRPTQGEIQVFGQPMNRGNRIAVLEIVRLEGQRGKKVCHYSLGMKQRLGIATALLGYPKLLILDEPTNGLDPAGIQEMRELIRDLPSRFGMTVVVSSHLLSEIDQMADTVGIIREGVLVFQDTLAALHGRSRHHLALRTTNNALAAQVLREKGIGWTEEGDYLVLPILPDEQAAGLCRALVEGRLGLVRLEERQKSLEDIFLELTGGKEVSL